MYEETQLLDLYGNELHDAIAGHLLRTLQSSRQKDSLQESQKYQGHSAIKNYQSPSLRRYSPTEIDGFQGLF